MEGRKILLDNMDKIHTTEMGAERIKRNLGLKDEDAVEFCKERIRGENCDVHKQGKNWYCETDGIRITVNSYSYTIITAHKI